MQHRIRGLASATLLAATSFRYLLPHNKPRSNSNRLPTNNFFCRSMRRATSLYCQRQNDGYRSPAIVNAVGALIELRLR